MNAFHSGLIRQTMAGTVAVLLAGAGLLLKRLRSRR